MTYRDQRHLLDRSMEAMGLEPIFANETAILGILYVIEIDDQRRSVRLSDLKSLLDL